MRGDDPLGPARGIMIAVGVSLAVYVLILVIWWRFG